MYECGSKTMLVVQAERGAVVLPILCGRTNGEDPCGRCRARRVERIRAQVLAEGAGGLYYRVVDADEAGRVVNRLKHNGARYKRLPLDGERVALIADQNGRLHGEPLPTDPVALDALLAELSATPGDERQSGSRGFGGRYANAKGRLRGKGYLVDERPSKVGAYLERAGASPALHGEGGVVVYHASLRQQGAALAAMEEAGIAVVERGPTAVDTPSHPPPATSDTQDESTLPVP